jgi:hypothetical protein
MATSSLPPSLATFPLRLVDGRRLERRYRDVLLPGGILCDRNGRRACFPGTSTR